MHAAVNGNGNRFELTWPTAAAPCLEADAFKCGAHGGGGGGSKFETRAKAKGRGPAEQLIRFYQTSMLIVCGLSHVVIASPRHG